jgi:hypothetical protein
MKNRFLIVSKATGLYNEVSGRFVIPGVRWVTGLCLVEPAEEVVTDKLKEIKLWEVKTCNEAEELIIKVCSLTPIISHWILTGFYLESK